MHRIGVITFHAAYNYGSALQATALQMFLEKNGYQVDILNFYDQLDMRQYKLFRTHYYFFPPIIIEDLRSYSNNKKRIDSYRKFQEKNMHITKDVFYSNEELKRICNMYDAFICGSDQIWNTSCTKGVKKPYYLDFAKDSKAFTMSYGPSIAHASIEPEYQEEFTKAVNAIQVISIREETGKQIIKQLTGREAEVVLDPTLLLDKEDYDLLKEPIKTPEKYVFVYCLEYNKEIYDYAYKLSKDKGLDLVYFRKFNISKFKGCMNSFPYGPGEFLSLIQNAEYIVTNSFHATVFSILFEKKFVTFTTKRSSSRMTDFLNKLNIGDRIEANLTDISKNINYKQVKFKLGELKRSSQDFLLDSLKENIGE